MDTDKGWILPPERLLDGKAMDCTDWIGRLCLKAVVDVQIRKVFDMTDDEEILKELLLALLGLKNYYEVNERVIQRHEGHREWDRFRLLHRQLAGAASEFAALTAGRPEGTCNTFKAQQVNRILLAVKELLGEDAGFALPMVSETGEQNYGDVSLLLRGWLDLCADYAWRHYDGNPPEIPQRDDSFRHRLVQEQILAFCQDEPKSMLEIGEMLCYRDRKTVRGYLAPLLDAGLLARTVPDKPNSRNQKYFTARMI
jgi:hypothetical protein